MAGLADNLPPELLRSDAKEAVIKYLQNSQLPARFRRKALQDWGETMGVAVTGEDYQAAIKWVGDPRRQPFGDWYR